jgi:spermidine/putrescine transport system substrate-binding protein
MKRTAYLLFILVALASCGESKKPSLHIFSWSEMLASDLVEEFEKTHHCNVIIDLYDSNESMYAKLKIGQSHYDIIFPSNYYLEIMEKQGMLRLLEIDKIPNHKYLDPQYYSPEKNLYGIPFMVSFSGLGYRSDRVTIEDPSYDVFNNALYSGRMTMFNDTRETLGACLKYLGYSVNSTNQDEIEQAADLLIKWKRNLAKFENEQYKNGLVNAEFLICQSYSGDILQIQKESEAIAFAYPKEGCILSIEYITIPANSPNPELAHAFINFMLNPRNAANNIERTHALTPIVASYPLLPEALQKNPILFPKEEYRKKMETIHDLGDQLYLYNRAWERVKGSR